MPVCPYVHHKSLYVKLLLHFKLEFLKTLHTCLLYGDAHVATAICAGYFLLRIFHQKVCIRSIF